MAQLADSKTLHFLRNNWTSAFLPPCCVHRVKIVGSGNSHLRPSSCTNAYFSHLRLFAVSREFLQSEFSEENLEFWLECVEFKRIKTGKNKIINKTTVFDQQIFRDGKTISQYASSFDGRVARLTIFNMAEIKSGWS
uniref:RGS domain-containing protein n=1 Tax=Globodera pallida TaxID=36090 RepID=A0A183CQC7_GLOPA